MNVFTMVDAIPLLGLPRPAQGKTHYYMPCPICGKRDVFNINLVKNVFRCNYCDVSGGVLDLYSRLANVSREEAKERLRAGTRCYVQKSPSASAHAKTEPQKLADVSVRDKVYRALLAGLPLASDHVANLERRGLSREQALALGYRTTPLVGVKQMAKTLADQGCALEGVPGFFLNKRGEWTYTIGGRGILMPVRNLRGQIQGIQIRLDDAAKGKCRWLSSGDMPVGRSCGMAAETWVHVAGSPSRQILLTEGVMKADIVHALTGATVLAVPGVNSLKYLPSLLELLKERGVRQVQTCFDMDFLSNPHVQQAYYRLLGMLSEAELSFGTLLWRPDYKGLDDFVAARRAQGSIGIE